MTVRSLPPTIVAAVVLLAGAAPQATAVAATYARISAGSAHTCAIAAAGTVACWGDRPVFEPSVD